MSLEKLLLLREAGAVKRCHTRRMRSQTLAEHCHGVCEIILAVRGNDVEANLLIAALRHDVYEYWTGDTPAVAKWAHPALSAILDIYEGELQEKYNLIPKLCGDDELLLKWADLCELIFFSLEELHSGNQYAKELVNNGLRNIGTYLVPPHDAVQCAEIIDYLRDIYTKGRI